MRSANLTVLELKFIPYPRDKYLNVLRLRVIILFNLIGRWKIVPIGLTAIFYMNVKCENLIKNKEV